MAAEQNNLTNQVSEPLNAQSGVPSSSSPAVDGVWKTPPGIVDSNTKPDPPPKPAPASPVSAPHEVTSAPVFTAQKPISQQSGSGKKSSLGNVVLWLVVLIVLAVAIVGGLVYADDTGILTTNIAVPLAFTHISSLTGGLSSDPKQAGTQVSNALQNKRSFALSGLLHGYGAGTTNLSCGTSDATNTASADSTACSSSASIDPLSLDTTYNLVVIGQNFTLKDTISDAGVNIQTEYRSVDGLLYSLSTFGSGAADATSTTSEGQWVKAGKAPAIAPDAIRDRIGSIIAAGKLIGGESTNHVPSYHFTSAITGSDISLLSVFAGSPTVDSWLKSNGSMDVWVSRKDHLPQRIQVTLADASKKNIRLDVTFGTTTVGEVVAPSGAIDPNSLLTPDQIRKSDLAGIASALAKYFAERGSYPISTTVEHLDKAGSVLAKALVPVYMTAIPKDTNTTRYYGYVSDGSTFELSAALDDANDPDAHTAGSAHLYAVKSPTKK